MQMYSARMALKQTAVLTLSAAIGAALFQALHSWPLIAALDMFAVFLLLRLFKMRMPAVYAFPLLPFVFPPEVARLLPAAALAASAVSFSLTLAYHHTRKRRALQTA